MHQAQGCLALIDLAGAPAARTAMLCTAFVYAHCVQRVFCFDRNTSAIYFTLPKQSLTLGVAWSCSRVLKNFTGRHRLLSLRLTLFCESALLSGLYNHFTLSKLKTCDELQATIATEFR